MRWPMILLCCSVLACCNDSTPTPPTDQRAPDLEATWLDRGPGEPHRIEARPPDGRRSDAAAADRRLVDVRPAAELKPASLQVQIVSVQVWANLMPIVAPDPTGVTIELSLVNSGAAGVTGLELVGGQIQPVPSGAVQAMELQAQPPFTGVVPAGQTVTATFTKVKKTTSVPMPTTCNGKVKVGFKVSHATGTLGPFWSGEVTLGCAY